MKVADIDRWRNIHQPCTDDPGPINDLDEARFVLGEHAGHGGRCLQYLGALRRASEVLP
jgi:hypothetical protein